MEKRLSFLLMLGPTGSTNIGVFTMACSADQAMSMCTHELWY